MKVVRGGGMWWRAAAAILILGVSSFFLINKLYKPTSKTLVENSRITIYDENDDPEKAFAEVQAALKKVSKKMNKGNDEAMNGLKKVQKASRELDKIVPE
jgi:F0F1-type ATP synthase membrane subunit b/b'